MKEWYVINTTSNSIENCITSRDDPREKFKDIWPEPKFKITTSPPMNLLRKYRYWNERP